jgi:hypothetical protein
MKTILLTFLALAIGILIGAYARRSPVVHAQSSPSVSVYEVTSQGPMTLKGGTEFLALSCTSDKAGNPRCFIASK